MHDSYYNTTHVSGSELARYKIKANSQEAEILQLYTSRWPRLISPSQALALLDDPRTPITSVRRAITNLTSKGALKRTECKVQGPYGRPEYCWTLNRPFTTVDMFDALLEVLP